MPNNMNAQNIYNMELQERRSFILENAKAVDTPDEVLKLDLTSAYQRAEVINTFLPDFIEIQIKEDSKGESALSRTSQREAIHRIANRFENEIYDWFGSTCFTEHTDSPRNLYELANVPLFALANKITRHISRVMGGMWEEVANISPRCIRPEEDFGVKITGIDLIFKDTSINYAQLKTQKNTLTGSQAPRSVSELKIQQNPLFCCAFPTATWTFPRHPNIKRVAGEEFWDFLGIDYTLVCAAACEMLQRLEGRYSDYQ